MDQGIFTDVTIKERFELPPHFFNYLNTLTNQVSNATLNGHEMMKDTIRWYAAYNQQKKRLKSDGQVPFMVLWVKGWSAKHWYGVSCDNAQSFGDILEVYDTSFQTISRVEQDEWEDFLIALKSRTRESGEGDDF